MRARLDRELPRLLNSTAEAAQDRVAEIVRQERAATKRRMFGVKR